MLLIIIIFIRALIHLHAFLSRTVWLCAQNTDFAHSVADYGKRVILRKANQCTK